MFYFRSVMIFALLAGGTPALAKDRKAAAPPSEIFTTLTRCRSVTDNQERLACYDAATQKIETAVNQNELYVVDKKQVRETRRSLFGLTLPSLGLFGGGDGDKNAVTEVEFLLRSAQSTPEGWRLFMEDGSIWQQTDDKMLGLSPKRGDKIMVKNASFGSYRASVSGQPSIKVKRIS